MVKGIVRKNRPLINLIVEWKLRTKEIVALVDTGFTGELKLSPQEVLDLEIDITHAESIVLGNEKTAQMFAGIASVYMEGIKNDVNVFVSGGIPTIGVGLLKRFGYNLNIDFKNDSLVLQKYI